jgi:membrane peptidoglycan carboxypeptidase
MVGGRDFGDNQYNRVTQAQRQPGSTFKPFVYTAAIASGVSPYKSYFDGEYSVDGYKPRNHHDRYRYAEVYLYDALAASINIVALRTMMDVGWNPAIELAHKMGIKSELKPTYLLALGALGFSEDSGNKNSRLRLGAREELYRSINLVLCSGSKLRLSCSRNRSTLVSVSAT